MNNKELIIGYLEHIPNKRCTILGLALLFQYYGIERELTAELIYQIYLDGDIIIIDHEEQHRVEVKLIPKLRIVN